MFLDKLVITQITISTWVYYIYYHSLFQYIILASLFLVSRGLIVTISRTKIRNSVMSLHAKIRDIISEYFWSTQDQLETYLEILDRDERLCYLLENIHERINLDAMWN